VCSVSGGPESQCDPSFTTPALADGPHTLTVRARFRTAIVGAPELISATASRSFTVDTTPPSLSVTTGPADGSTSSDPGRTATFGFVASDATTSVRAVECKLDGGAFSPCASSGSQTYSGLADGAHTFTVRATDAAGNATSRTVSWTVAVPAPVDQTPAPPGDQTQAPPGTSAGPSGPVAPLGPTPPRSPKLPALGAGVKASFKPARTGTTTVSALTVTKVPAGATVTVACFGSNTSCKFKRKTLAIRRATPKVALVGLFKKAPLAKGTKIEVRVTKPGTVGVAVAFTMQSRKQPKQVTATPR
jgi:hypothetical protein